jgi:hypothetical protein
MCPLAVEIIEIIGIYDIITMVNITPQNLQFVPVLLPTFRLVPGFVEFDQVRAADLLEYIDSR